MSDFSFIKSLSEGRLIRSSKKLENLTLKNVTDLFFLHVMILEILKYEYDFAPFALQYAKKTWRTYSDKSFRSNGTDLALLAHSLANLDDYFKTPKDEVFKNRIYYNEREFKEYIKRIMYNRINKERDRRYTLKISYDLHVEMAYRAIRRLVIDWEKNNRHEKQLVVTRLLMAIRHKGILSDLYPPLQALAEKQKLELKNVYNPERHEYEGEAQPEQQAHDMSWKKKLALAAAAIGAGALTGKALGKMYTGKK